MGTSGVTEFTVTYNFEGTKALELPYYSAPYKYIVRIGDSELYSEKKSGVIIFTPPGNKKEDRFIYI